MANHRLTVVVEDCVPYIHGALEPYAEVRYLPNHLITAPNLQDVDAVIGRTRTAYGPEMLTGTPVRLCCTATIGTDQIDMPWCAAHGMRVANAPGCNAPAVAQYVLTAILNLIHRPLPQYRLGIVGVGHVGALVERWARSMDMEVMLCDPPRAEKEGPEGFSTLEEIAAKCDIITFHTPLDATTRHLADEAFFASLRRAPIIINASRGAVVDTAALIRAIDQGRVSHTVIDTWEGEPQLSLDLLRRTDIATHHIAGYSIQGKIRATRACVDAVAQNFGLPPIELPEAPQFPLDIPHRMEPRLLLDTYDIMADDSRLRQRPEAFEQLRDTYTLRPETSTKTASTAL